MIVDQSDIRKKAIEYLNVVSAPAKNPSDLAKLALAGSKLVDPADVTESFVKFANLPVNLNMLRMIGHKSQVPPGQLLSYFQYCRWVVCGMPVFRPSEDLAAGLALTDVGDISTKDWKWPFSCFLIHIPYEFWSVDSPLTNLPDPVTMLLLTRMRLMAGDAAATMLMLGREGSMTFSQVHLPDDEHPTSIGEWFGRTSNTNKNSMVGSDLFALSDKDQNNTNKCWGLAVNTCLYITERGKGQLQRPYTTKRAKKRSQLAGKADPKPNVWVIGQEIKLSRELIRSAHSQVSDVPAWKINKQFVVRGHWRNQPHGPERQLVKRIFIQPFWKGPKEGERLSHLYTDK